jgi:hypothetical protein
MCPNASHSQKLTTLQAKTGLEQADELVKVAVSLVLFDKVGKLFCVHDEVETADLSKTELLPGNAGLVDLSPDCKAKSQQSFPAYAE